MNGTTYRKGLSWSARFLIAFVLILVGAAAATWCLANYRPAARFLGVATADRPPSEQKPLALMAAPAPQAAPPAPTNAQIAQLQVRLANVENATQRAEGFAGRADALVIAFAARRAIDRGVALGYLEPLLVDRFGAQHQQAVGTVIASARQPVGLNDLIAEYDDLGPDLRRGGPQDSWWTNFQRELGTLVEVHPAKRPAANPDARTSARASGLRPATSIRRWPKRCGFRAQPMRRTGSEERGATSPRTGRWTRSNPRRYSVSRHQPRADFPEIGLAS